jgi:hypothetical protein
VVEADVIDVRVYADPPNVLSDVECPATRIQDTRVRRCGGRPTVRRAIFFVEVESQDFSARPPKDREVPRTHVQRSRRCGCERQTARGSYESKERAVERVCIDRIWRETDPFIPNQVCGGAVGRRVLLDPESDGQTILGAQGSDRTIGYGPGRASRL